MNKTTEQLIEEFLAKGGQVETLAAVEVVEKKMVNSITKRNVNLLSLQEAEGLFGQRNIKEPKVKKPDYSEINMDLIPDHLKRLILSKEDNDITKE